MLGLNHRGLHVSSGTRYVIFKSQLMYYKVFRYDSDKNLCFISKTNQTPNVLSNQNESTRVHLIRTWSGHLFFLPRLFFFDTRHTRMGNKSVLSVLIFCWIFSFIPAENITGKMYWSYNVNKGCILIIYCTVSIMDYLNHILFPYSVFTVSIYITNKYPSKLHYLPCLLY